MSRCQLMDYFIKNLNPDEIRGIAGMLREAITPMFSELATDEENDYENIMKSWGFKSKEQLLALLKKYTQRVDDIDERMRKNGLAPLFESIPTVKGKLDYIELLCTFDEQTRWNKMLGCESFDAFVPPRLEK